MPDAGLTAMLAALHAAGVRWTISGGGMPVPVVFSDVKLDDQTLAQLHILKPHRAQLAELARAGGCPGCGQFRMPPLVVCFWCARPRA